VKIKLSNPAEVEKLMDSAAYEAYIAAKGKEASPDALPSEEPRRAAGNAGRNWRKID